MRGVIAGSVVLLMVSACASDRPPASVSVPAPASVETAAATAKTRSCLDLIRIRESKVRDDRTIDFIMTGGEIYRSRLPYNCPQLGFERAFSYSTSLSQLCSTDIITVIRQGGGPLRGASCGLGPFVQISADQANAK